MQVITRWAFFILVSLLAFVAGRTLAQSGPLQQTPARTATPGRYAVYYRSADYSQVLLLDTTSGAIWELTTSKYKSLAEGHQGEEVAFHTFQRIGVEGVYESIPDKILNQQLNQQFLDQQKDNDHH